MFASFFLGAFLIGSPAHAAITVDLSYVDLQSENYQRFKTWVDQAVAGNPGYAFSAMDAAYMYRLTGQSQYASLAVEMVEEQVVAAESAIAAGQRPEVAADSYLHVGDMIGDLAITHDWCSTHVTANQRARWGAYANQAIFNVWNPDEAQWGGQSFTWSGWSIDDPANNYFYSFIEATMYWSLASDNAANLDFLSTVKLPLLVEYFSGLPGGGSQEGTAYGLSHRNLFALYRVWRDSTGVDLASATDHLTDSVSWWIHATVPTLDRTAAIGDQARVSEPVIYDYHREIMLAARTMTADTGALDDAAWWLGAIPNQDMESGFNYRHNLLPAGNGGTPPAELVYHATGTGQLFARTGWDIGAMWLQFSAGPYVQSHAHQDQGSFTLFQDDWLSVTENIWSHSGIQQGTEVHNILRFENAGEIVRQREGTTSTITVTPGTGGAVHAVANLTPAYNGNPAVQNWQRTIDFASRKLVVRDTYATGSGTTATFQINVPVYPSINGSTAQAGQLKVRVLSPANATLTAVDWTSVDSDYNSGWRIDVRGGTGEYVVELSVTDNMFGNGFD